MKVYTRTGDDGSTGLFGGPRVEKDDPRIEAYGTVDELNAAIGLARAAVNQTNLQEQLEQIQNDLFTIGAELATRDPERHRVPRIQGIEIERLEAWIDALETQLPPLHQFVLPAGSEAAARLHVARAICRRSERRVISLCHSESQASARNVIRYLNRLSDLLFVQARFANQSDQGQELPWQKPSSARPN